VQNSAVQIARDRPIDVYFKSKLVPGAEFFPFREYLPFIKPLVDMLQGSVAGLTGQKTRGVFRSEIANAAPVICYESVYGQYVGGYVRNGADVIFIVTNDGWWDKTPGHVQHLKIGAIRAIEHRKPIARSANTGISCFINARGDVLQPTKYRETIAISGKITPGEEMTFYTKWGDIIARIAVFLAVLVLERVITLSVMRKKASDG
jgi:apolipoprotein N-acyltransferase